MGAVIKPIASSPIALSNKISPVITEVLTLDNKLGHQENTPLAPKVRMDAYKKKINNQKG